MMKRLLFPMVLLLGCMICGCGSQPDSVSAAEKPLQKAVSETGTQAAEADGKQSVGYHVYPDTSEMKAEQISEACRIPEAELDAMSTEQLAQAVADYPLLWEIETSSSTEYDLEWLAEQSDAYKELLTREEAVAALFEKCRTLESDPDHAVCAELLKKVVSHEKAFQNELTDSDKEYLDS